MGKPGFPEHPPATAPVGSGPVAQGRAAGIALVRHRPDPRAPEPRRPERGSGYIGRRAGWQTRSPKRARPRRGAGQVGRGGVDTVSVGCAPTRVPPSSTFTAADRGSGPEMSPGSDRVRGNVRQSEARPVLDEGLSEHRPPHESRNRRDANAVAARPSGCGISNAARATVAVGSRPNVPSGCTGILAPAAETMISAAVCSPPSPERA